MSCLAKGDLRVVATLHLGDGDEGCLSSISTCVIHGMECNSSVVQSHSFGQSISYLIVDFDRSEQFTAVLSSSGVMLEIDTDLDGILDLCDDGTVVEFRAASLKMAVGGGAHLRLG